MKKNLRRGRAPIRPLRAILIIIILIWGSFLSYSWAQTTTEYVGLTGVAPIFQIGNGLAIRDLAVRDFAAELRDKVEAGEMQCSYNTYSPGSYLSYAVRALPPPSGIVFPENSTDIVDYLSEAFRISLSRKNNMRDFPIYSDFIIYHKFTCMDEDGVSAEVNRMGAAMTAGHKAGKADEMMKVLTPEQK